MCGSSVRSFLIRRSTQRRIRKIFIQNFFVEAWKYLAIHRQIRYRKKKKSRRGAIRESEREKIFKLPVSEFVVVE